MYIHILSHVKRALIKISKCVGTAINYPLAIANFTMSTVNVTLNVPHMNNSKDASLLQAEHVTSYSPTSPLSSHLLILLDIDTGLAFTTPLPLFSSGTGDHY